MKKVTISKELGKRMDETRLRIEREKVAMDVLKDNHVLDDLIYTELLDEVVTAMLEYKYKTK